MSHVSKLIIWGSSWGWGFRFHWLLSPDASCQCCRSLDSTSKRHIRTRISSHARARFPVGDHHYIELIEDSAPSTRDADASIHEICMSKGTIHNDTSPQHDVQQNHTNSQRLWSITSYYCYYHYYYY